MFHEFGRKNLTTSKQTVPPVEQRTVYTLNILHAFAHSRTFSLKNSLFIGIWGPMNSWKLINLLGFKRVGSRTVSNKIVALSTMPAKSTRCDVVSNFMIVDINSLNRIDIQSPLSEITVKIAKPIN